MALVQDFVRAQIAWFEVLIDIAILMVFIMLLVFGLKKTEIKSVHPGFGIAYILLLGFNYIEQGGIHGISLFSYYTGFMVIILLYSGKPMVALISSLSLVLLVTTFATYNPGEEIKSFFLESSTSPINFLFILFLLAVSSFFMKEIIGRETSKYFQLNDELQKKVIEAKALNMELVQQGKALQSAQDHLENEVKLREATLEKQQNSIEAFIRINTQVLQEPVLELSKAVQELPTSGQLETMMHISQQELSQVLKDITQTLEENQHLDRSKIRR